MAAEVAAATAAELPPFPLSYPHQQHTLYRAHSQALIWPLNHRPHHHPHHPFSALPSCLTIRQAAAAAAAVAVAAIAVTVRRRLRRN